MAGALDSSVRLALDKLREYLREHADTDFADAADFADRVLGELNKAFANGWAGEGAKRTIRTTTKSIYEFYRLRDLAKFGGEQAPVRMVLGGPDRVSIKFIGELDHFYFSKFADNTSDSLRKFFVKRYFEEGSAIFGRVSPERLAEFRAAAGDKLKNLTDRQTQTIVQTAVQRVRNWADIGSLHQAKIDLAKLVATLDARTSQFCLTIDGKIIRVGVAEEAIQRLNKLTPELFAQELYESDLAKRLRKEPAANIREYLEDDGKTIGDVLVATGLGIPPFHPNCRTRVEAIIDGVDDNS